MELLSLTLTNFKAHRDRKFEFQPGTNAICGENGAGKTSLVEAIAWVLFNYRGAYTKEDLIRNGANSAQVRVQFISNRDGRTYEVSRCTHSGYSIYDPQLKAKLNYSRIEEEILPWLRQHLGLTAGTDLARLFSTTLGIPQGTFTADFLLTPEKRKPIFDRILKVEEYQQVYKQTLALQRYAEAEVDKLKTAIAHYQDSLADWDALTTKQQDLQTQIQAVSQEAETVTVTLVQLQDQLAELQQQGDAIQTLDRQIEVLRTKIQAQSQQRIQAQQQLNLAQEAAQICEEASPAYQGYLQAEAQLQTLESQRQAYVELQTQRQRLQENLREHQVELQRDTQELERLEQLQVELGTLTKPIQQQVALEERQAQLQLKLQASQTQQLLLARENAQLGQVHDQIRTLQTDIEALQGLAPIVEQIPTLEAQQTRIQNQMSRIEAASQFKAELQQLLADVSDQANIHLQQVTQATQQLEDLKAAVPLWSEPVEMALATLRDGQTLQAKVQKALGEILIDLEAQTARQELQQQLQETQSHLQAAQRQQQKLATLDPKLQRLAELEQDAEQRTQHLQGIRAELAELHNLQPELETVRASLAALNNPQARRQFLTQELQHQPQRLRSQAARQQRLLQSQTELDQLDQQLVEFADLAQQIQAQQHLRDQCRSGYQRYLQHQDRSQQVQQQADLTQSLTTTLDAYEAEQEHLIAQRNNMAQTYDLEKFHTLQAQVQDIQAQQIRAQARLPEIQARLVDVDTQIQHLQNIQAQCQAAELDLKQREKVRRFIVFARKAYKEAGPRITERYIANVSREADRLFRELINRPNVSLTWTRDYEILVREDANQRRFVNLSGGEQMCAALAVRLALLRVLADLDIAFFDEPTTNMDHQRRQQLASAIANLRNFRQLFVISHDDTFEQVTENVIIVERES